MKRRYHLSRHVGVVAIGLLVLGAAAISVRAATSASAEDEPATTQDVVSQVKQLQQQLADLRKQVNEMGKSRTVAAGTATYSRPAIQDNSTFSRVKLSPEIASKLGDEYIVLLTNRYPTGGYPFFGVYWKRAADGFDIYLVDIEINDGTTASYSNPNTKYLIDWAVIRK